MYVPSQPSTLTQGIAAGTRASSFRATQKAEIAGEHGSHHGYEAAAVSVISELSHAKVHCQGHHQEDTRHSQQYLKRLCYITRLQYVETNIYIYRKVMLIAFTVTSKESSISLFFLDRFHDQLSSHILHS